VLTCLEEHRVVDVVLKVLLLLPELDNDNKVASMVSGDATFECSSLISTTRGLADFIADTIWRSSDDSIIGSSFLGCLDTRV
jgi:hypothetical protein